jgi:hypothetical protein
MDVRYRDRGRVRTDDVPVGATHMLHPIDATRAFSKEPGAFDFLLITTEAL